MASSADELKAIADVVREEVLRRLPPDSCIATTRAIVDTLTYFGVSVRPVAVHVVAFNPPGWAMACQQIPAEHWPDEAWSVGSDKGATRPGRWAGHLVALADGIIIDGSISQMSRPEHDIVLDGPVLCPAPATWPRRAGQAGYRNRLVYTDPSTGVVLVYLQLNDPTWRRTEAWKPSPGMRQIVSDSIARLRPLPPGPSRPGRNI